MTDIKFVHTKLHSLVIFRSILQDPVFSKFDELLAVAGKRDASIGVDFYASFVSSLFIHNMDFSHYVLDYLKNDENLYLKRVIAKKEISIYLQACLAHELALLQDVSQITGEQIKQYIPYEGFMPEWHVTKLDFESIYAQHLDQIDQNGYGVYSKYNMFLFDEGKLCPVVNPDNTKLENLTGYEYERSKVLNNTRALLAGKSAANVLLYGDSGTGKSSTVKAVLNEFHEQGLRLVEVRQKQLHEIPALIEKLADNPLKFILFIDDISFALEDEDFTALKATLEGSALMRTDNIAIYATSNRRHLVHETFSDRQGDEIHINETIQHTVSLSDRFGLTVPFLEPGKQKYLDIVEHIAARYALELSKEELHKRAEEFALSKGGRSPRVARQFVQQVVAGVL